MKHGWMPYLRGDIGLRRTDGAAHFPNFMYLRSAGPPEKQVYKRSQEAWNKKRTRSNQLSRLRREPDKLQLQTPVQESPLP